MTESRSPIVSGEPAAALARQERLLLRIGAIAGAVVAAIGLAPFAGVSLSPVAGEDFLLFVVILPIESVWLVFLGLLMWRRGGRIGTVPSGAAATERSQG